MLKPNDQTHLATSETGSSSQKSSDVTPEQEYFLYELETSDSGSIGLVLRAIYDGGDVHKFLRALEKKIRHYDKDIEKLCNYHYHGFVDAVHELLDLKTQCHHIKQDIVEIDRYLKENSKFLMEKAREIVKLRKTQKNIASAIDSVSYCLPVFEKYSRLQEQMEQKKYYPALKTLEQLEHTYLPRVERYRVAQKMKDAIVAYREQIKDASFSEFTDFLENIRKVTAKIGEVALRHAKEMHSMDASISKKRLQQRKFSLATPDRQQALMNATSERPLDVVEEEEFSAQDMVDFSPVYKCCLIFAVLNAKDTFDAYYRKQRREQAGLLVRAPESITRGNLETFSTYFHEVVGFFVVEDHIMNTANGLVTRAYRDELWELAASHVERTLAIHFGHCNEASIMLSIKNDIIMFALTMKGYGFQVTTLYKILQNFRDQYNGILMAKHCAEFDNILLTDNYTPIIVDDEDDLRTICDRFPLAYKTVAQDKAVANGDASQPVNGFPKRFPFSEFVPKIYEQVKEYVRGCLKFMDNLGMSQTDIDDTIRRSTNLLFEQFSIHLKRYLMGELVMSSSVKQARPSLVQFIQITINMGYLEKSCEYLEQFIAKSTGTATAGGHVARLKEDMFRDARSEVEQKIDEAMREKMDGFLSVAQYTWDLNESSGRASGYITDLISFLQTTFVSFTNLPEVLGRHICMQACKYLSSRLMGFLMDADVKQLSAGALEQFNLDVIQCEQFTATCPVRYVAGSEENILIETFADLRQLLDLIMSSDWSTYLADFGQDRSKYVRVHPNTVICLIEKMIENERRKNSIFAKSKDKDRRKLLDTVLKQLRNLSNGGGHA